MHSNNNRRGLIVMNTTAVIPTGPLHGYQVIFSPYTSHKLAFVGANNYGISGIDLKPTLRGSRATNFLFSGKGSLVLYEEILSHNKGYKEVGRYGWNDGLFDVTWSEVNEAVLVAAAGDGKLIIVDQSSTEAAPVAVLVGHTAEVLSLFQ